MKNLEKISTRQPILEVVTEPATKSSKRKKYELIRKFMNKIIADKKDINDEIFQNYLQKSSFLAIDLIGATQGKNEQLVSKINDGLIDLVNATIKK